MFDVEFKAISFRKGGKVAFFSHVINRAADEVERGESAAATGAGGFEEERRRQLEPFASIGVRL